MIEGLRLSVCVSQLVLRPVDLVFKTGAPKAVEATAETATRHNDASSAESGVEARTAEAVKTTNASVETAKVAAADADADTTKATVETSAAEAVKAAAALGADFLTDHAKCGCGCDEKCCCTNSFSEHKNFSRFEAASRSYQ